MHRKLPILFALALSLAARTALADDAKPHVHPTAGSDEGSAVPTHQKHNLDAKKPKLHGKMVSLKTGAGNTKAYAARPKGEAKGAVLVLHEWWGLNDWVKHQADQLAEHGYLALAVDLYKGKLAKDPKTAGELMKGLDEAHGDRVEEAAIEWLKNNASSPKVATIGWCMGGGQSLRASLHDAKDVSATVIYYGMPVTEVAELKKLQGPVLGIWANKDGWITPEVVAKFDAALTEAGVKHEFHAYDADHAFANPSNGEKYKSEFADEAWKHTLAFLDAAMSGEKKAGEGSGTDATSGAETGKGSGSETK